MYIVARATARISYPDVVYSHDCSVKDIVHERTWLKGSIYDVEVSHFPWLAG